MKPSSAKQKGRLAQQAVRDLLRNKYVSLDFEDVESRGMGQQGTDIILSPAAKKRIPFDIEVKAQENISIWSCLEQAENNTSEGRIPLLVFKRNRTKLYATLPFDDLLRLL